MASKAFGQANPDPTNVVASERSPAASRLELKPISPGVLGFGTVVLNKTQRSVSWPVSINQRTGVVEYAVVTATGKTHESVFRTDAQPEDIHMAVLLLGGKPGNTNQFPSDLSAPLPGDQVEIEVSWTEKGRDVRQPLENFVITINNQKILSPGPWTYNGSHIFEGRFTAQMDGSIISLHIDPRALVNNPRQGRENDDLHYVNSPGLPPQDAALKLTMKLLSESPRFPQASPTTEPRHKER